MAQSKVSDYFSTRKGSTGLQPSKRRKLENTVAPEPQQVTQTFTSPPLALRTRSRKTVSITNAATQQKTKPSTRKKATKTNKIQDVSQTTIIDAFKSSDLATAALDDHNASPPCSPSKKKKTVEETDTKTKRSRAAKSKDLLDALSDIVKTPERAFDFSKSMEKGTTSARKKLILKSPKGNNSLPAPVQVESTIEVKKQVTHGESKVQAKVPDKELNQRTDDVPNNKVKVQQQQKTKNVLQKSKDIDTAALKAKLMNDGKFAEMQEKLAEYSKKKAQLSSPAKSSKPKLLSEVKESSPKAPAFERFHALAEPVPPTLGLPFKYKLLAEMFRGMDTVVSMLHKRSETCTFSKLKAAVQQLVRKNFEENNLGQIKTVYPSAYMFRQEKGLHRLTGGNENTYQMTVEANLEKPLGQKEDEKVLLDKYGRPVFTAAHLTDRSSNFHRNLINIVKKHHKEFLTKLEKPLSIDDKKIKRWHPQFKLDSVPDIEPSPLPQPPNVKKLTTAAEVLEHAKSSLNPRIQRALKLAAGQFSPKKNSPLKSEGVENKPLNNAKSDTSAEKNKNLSGVSQSLLERIRAKEAAKTEAAMLRSPEEEARLKRIERLPELARILRTVYVTQKKPALLLEEVINKLGESYKSNMGKAESEKHVLLLVDLVPDWVQVVQIKRGRFLKMDKNKDINVIQDKLQKIFKDAK